MNYKKILFILVAILLIVNFTEDLEAQINFGDNPFFDPDSPGIKVIIVAPPEVFTLPGSETTNFTRVCTLGEALNIVLDVVGKNKIAFEGPIVDMCDNETIENLDQYIQLDKVGEVTVRSDILPYLREKPAEITMRNLPFEEEPNIEIDDRPATTDDIENKVWDQSQKTFKFRAKHFTTYRAVAKITQPPPPTSLPLPDHYPRDVYTFPISDFLLTIGILSILLVVAVLLYFFLRKRRTQ